MIGKKLAKTAAIAVRTIYAAVPSALALFFVFCAAAADENYKNARAEKSREILAAALEQCFAAEGAYPAEIDYLAKNYGMTVDRARFTFDYSVDDDDTRNVVFELIVKPR